MDYKLQICSVISRIEQNIKNKPDYRDLEKSVGFSYRHIREIFKNITRISLSRYILARKIANAAFEIRHSEKSVTDIAFDYGFDNLDTFTRAFKRDTGLTPSGFKKSDFLCGRKIICMGVFAPVILNLNNPEFIPPNFQEVNEMCEMKKTSDSCVLYGVPKVYYGRQIDGQTQVTPFPMCLQAVLNYMGQNISYTQIMAASGAAFRQRWDAGGWNLAAVDIRFTYEEHLKPFELAFKGAGRSYKILENPNKPKSVTKEAALELIKSEIDCGRPVIALGVVGPPEACIVTGYRDNGEKLLGWSLFQNGSGFGGAFDIDESGYFIKDNWWENTEAVMSVGEEVNEYTPVKEVLKNALMLMTTERVETYGGIKRPGSSFYGGQAAYEAWAKAVEGDSFFTGSSNVSDICYCQGDAEEMLGGGRYYAAEYIGSLSAQYPHLSKELAECADLLKSASECAEKMFQTWSGTYPGVNEASIARLKERETRIKIAAFIRQAAKFEKDACVKLKDIIDKL
ncbi:MAG: helix-turn-helix domain-containing protein [Oscillospiraceae bacterium]|nr:helix-turn-helix domain-containing protein [Oscillospiraceae bacterium]